MNSYRLVFMCLENAKRELDGKIILAASILSHSPETIIVIGDQNVLFKVILILRVKALILVKSAQFYMYKYFKRIKKQNSVIILQDEEGMFTMEDDGISGTNRNYNIVKKYVDFVFCWNKKEYHSYKGLRSSTKILITGNPRTSILGSGVAQKFYQRQIEDIKSEYGKFILYCSTFCQAIPYGKLSASEYLELVKLSESYSQTEYERQVAWSRYVHYSVFEILSFIKEHSERYSCGLTQTKLVFRPHPSDDLAFILKLFGDLPGVFIEDKYPIAPWLCCADAVFGSTCSTLVEAAAAGNIPISYLPRSSLSIREYLVDLAVNKVGLIVADSRQIQCVLSKVGDDRDSIINSLKKDECRNGKLNSLIGPCDSISKQAEVIHSNCQFLIKDLRTKFTVTSIVYFVSLLSILVKAAYFVKASLTSRAAGRIDAREDKFSYLDLDREQIRRRISEYSNGGVKIELLNSSVLILSSK